MCKEKKYLLDGLVVAVLVVAIYLIPDTSLAQSDTLPNSPYLVSTYVNDHAEHHPTGDESNQEKVNRGDYALQFRIDNNFTLKDFSGTLISFQKTLSNRNAIRWGLSLNGDYNGLKNEPDTTGHKGGVNIGISMNYLWYTPIRREIRFYYGAGPTASFGYQKTKTSQENGFQRNITTLGEVGIAGAVGVEWFFHPHISLMAEYVPELTATYTHFIQKQPGSRNKTSEINLNLGSAPVRFGISVYF